ncbi:MAG: autotransporter outer membrane beta-barrel domain-containing protein, partial [Deltaproteobacteria bacterium]|nr:autotransporter outer membrane beta-barrel domain-containing protein [Deltaproteobacteria bacterium]
DVQTNHLTIGGTLQLANNSYLEVATDSEGLIGSFVVQNLSIDPTARIQIIIDETAVNLTTRQEFLSAESGTFNLRNFVTTHNISLNNQGNILLGKYNELGDTLINNVSDILNLNLTPNITSISTMLNSIERTSGFGAEVDNFINILRDLPDPETLIRSFIGEIPINVTTAVAQAVIEGQALVYGRLDRIRGLESVTPPGAGSFAPSAGSDDELNRLWIGSFGILNKVKDSNYVLGYDFKTAGFSFGYDRFVNSITGLRIGFSASFSFGSLDSSDKKTTVDIDTAGLGIYASYLTDSGIFMDGSLALSHATNDYSAAFVNGSFKSGSFDVTTWQFGARVGTIIHSGSLQFVSSIGLRYISFDQEGWAETVNQFDLLGLANRFDKKDDHQIDIPILLKLNNTFKVGSVAIVPELRFGVTYSAKRTDDGLRVGFVGSNEFAVIHGIKPSRFSFEAGFGAKVITDSNFDIFLNYDFEGSSGSRNHQLSFGFGYDF